MLDIIYYYYYYYYHYYYILMLFLLCVYAWSHHLVHLILLDYVTFISTYPRIHVYSFIVINLKYNNNNANYYYYYYYYSKFVWSTNSIIIVVVVVVCTWIKNLYRHVFFFIPVIYWSLHIHIPLLSSPFTSILY